MSQFDVLDRLVEEGNGYLKTAQVLANGVSKPTLAEFVKRRNMERVAQGVYFAEDAWPDTLFLAFTLRDEAGALYTLPSMADRITMNEDANVTLKTW